MMHKSMEALEAGLEEILQTPADDGELMMIVRRPLSEQREVLEEAELDTGAGLIGDRWLQGGTPEVDRQLTIMNARVTSLVAGDREHWPLAGDQLYVDMDLSDENLPPGTRLALGSAVLEVSAVPHTGCKKFVARYGKDAMIFVNSRRGKQLNLRGINARIVQSGRITIGDRLHKL